MNAVLHQLEEARSVSKSIDSAPDGGTPSTLAVRLETDGVLVGFALLYEGAVQIRPPDPELVSVIAQRLNN